MPTNSPAPATSSAPATSPVSASPPAFAPPLLNEASNKRSAAALLPLVVNKGLKKALNHYWFDTGWTSLLNGKAIAYKRCRQSEKGVFILANRLSSVFLNFSL